jgi:hypothetical protein
VWSTGGEDVNARLIDREGDEIGAQRHTMPSTALLPHLGSAEALTEFVRSELLPRVAKATITAYLGGFSQDGHDAALEGIGQVELSMTADGEPLTWVLDLTGE